MAKRKKCPIGCVPVSALGAEVSPALNVNWGNRSGGLVFLVREGVRVDGKPVHMFEMIAWKQWGTKNTPGVDLSSTGSYITATWFGDGPQVGSCLVRDLRAGVNSRSRAFYLHITLGNDPKPVATVLVRIPDSEFPELQAWLDKLEDTGIS